MEHTHTQRTLPPDVFDYLELSAYVEKGIGGRNFSRLERQEDWLNAIAPCCIWGHAGCTDAAELQHEERNAVQEALLAAGITFEVNDDAVSAINTRKGRPQIERFARVSWEEYTAELNIVRGEAVS